LAERDFGPQGLWKLDPLPPVLQSVKDRFPAGSEWLWKTCNENLDPGWDSLDMELAERARILGLVLDNPRRGALIPYPLRPPPGSLAPSESVDKLRVILARAPRIPQSHSGYDEVPGMDRHEYWDPEWDVQYDWNSDYRNEILEALIGVVKQHGAGDNGWALARWEVYDTVSIRLSLGFTGLIFSDIRSMRNASRGFHMTAGKGDDGLTVQNIGLMLQWRGVRS